MMITFPFPPFPSTAIRSSLFIIYLPLYLHSPMRTLAAKNPNFKLPFPCWPTVQEDRDFVPFRTCSERGIEVQGKGRAGGPDIKFSLLPLCSGALLDQSPFPSAKKPHGKLSTLISRLFKEGGELCFSFGTSS